MGVFVPLITIKMNCTENQTKESDSRMNPSLIIGIGQHVSHDTQTKKVYLTIISQKASIKRVNKHWNVNWEQKKDNHIKISNCYTGKFHWPLNWIHIVTNCTTCVQLLRVSRSETAKHYRRLFSLLWMQIPLTKNKLF